MKRLIFVDKLDFVLRESRGCINPGKLFSRGREFGTMFVVAQALTLWLKSARFRAEKFGTIFVRLPFRQWLRPKNNYTISVPKYAEKYAPALKK